MNIKKYNDKVIRITDDINDTFEGIATYNDREYNYHEFGKDEESLDLIGVKFYKSFIKKVESLENHKGPYGKYSSPYGYLEEFLLESGPSFIEEVFDSEENEHIYRMLLCLEDNFDKVLKDKEEIFKLLNDLVKYNDDLNIVNKAKEILKR